MPEKIQERYEDTLLYRIRHSTAHVMAQAVLEKFPDGQIAIGPAIEDGFYYDFDLPRPLTPEDLTSIEARMREIIRGKYPFIRKEVSADDARAIFKGQTYKQELIDGLQHGGMDEHGNPLIGNRSHFHLYTSILSLTCAVVRMLSTPLKLTRTRSN